MQDIYKDQLVLEAIKTAISSFAKKNGITNGMDYFADQLGFHGNNRSIQLHNRLSPTNIEKYLKLEELFFILTHMDQEDQKIILDALTNKYGFYVKEKEESESKVIATLETIVTIGTLELGGTLGVINDDVVQAIKDGKIDELEAKRLLRSLREMNGKTRGVEDALIKFLGI